MRILLLCAAGMSTSLIMNKMKRTLNEDEKDWVIDAKPIDQFALHAKDYDVILLGPQMTFKKEELKEKAEKLGVQLDVMDSFAYGIGDGESILNQAKEIYERGNTK